MSDETCSCHNSFRGQAAMIPALPPNPVANDKRLSTPQNITAKPNSKLADTALVQDWIPFHSHRYFWEQETLKDTIIGQLTLKTDVQRHMITALVKNKAVERYRGDGRTRARPSGWPGLC